MGPKPSITRQKLAHHRHRESKWRSETIAEALSRDSKILLFRWLVHSRQEQWERAHSSSTPDVIRTSSGVWKRSDSNALIYEKTDNANQVSHLILPDDDASSSKCQDKALPCGSVAGPPRYLVRPRFPVNIDL